MNSEIKIGHVHLKVSNITTSLDFYCGILGFKVTQRIGNSVAFISSGTYHHQIGLNTWESEGGSPPTKGTTGLYHFAILYPKRSDLAEALLKLQQNRIQIIGASDHGVSEAIYIEDPDKNGLELYWDKPKEEWPYDEDSNLKMFSKPLNLKNLLSELN